jgi:CP family cyanate transporter-like MFS transporter
MIPQNDTADRSLGSVAGSYRWVLLGGVWLLYFAFGLTIAAMAPLVHLIRVDLGLSDAAMGSVLGAWPLVYIAAAMPCGALLDRAGPRRALFVGALIIGASGVMRGLAGGHLDLFMAVALFGIGGPLISIGAPKLVAHWFEGKDRGLAMGIYITGPATGGILALSLTNSVVMPLTGGDWRQVLFIYAAIAAATGVVWLVLFLHPAARAFEAQLAAEHKRPQIGVFAGLLKLPAVRLLLAMSIGIFFFNHGLNNWLPEILRRGGFDAVSAGYWAALPTVVGIFGSLLIPRMAIPSRRFVIFGLLIAGAGTASLLLQLTGMPTALAIGLAFQGIARSSLMTLAMLVMVETRGVGARNAGAAGGLFFSAAEIGGVLGPLTLGAMSDLTGGFASGLYLLTAISFMLGVLLAWLRRIEETAKVAG